MTFNVLSQIHPYLKRVRIKDDVCKREVFSLSFLEYILPPWQNGHVLFSHIIVQLMDQKGIPEFYVKKMGKKKSLSNKQKYMSSLHRVLKGLGWVRNIRLGFCRSFLKALLKHINVFTVNVILAWAVSSNFWWLGKCIWYFRIECLRMELQSMWLDFQKWQVSKIIEAKYPCMF